MKYYIHIFLSIILMQFILGCFNSSSRITKGHNKYVCDAKSQYDSLIRKQVYVFVEDMPKYPGGNIEVLKFFTTNFKSPEQEMLQTSFQVEFVIDIDGKLVGGRIKNKPSNLLTQTEREVVRIFSLMPNWIPGKCSGSKVPVLVSFPLTL